MRRALKYLFVFVALIVVAGVAAVVLIPREKIVELAADKVREATGRELTLTGELSPSFWPVLGVRTGPVTLSNAEWGETDNMISASAAEVGVELMPLFSGEVKVTALRLIDPVMALEVNKDGEANWEFGDGSVSHSGSGAGSGSDDGLPKISLPEAIITNGRISFSDAQTGQRIELASLDLKAGLEGFDKPLNLSGSGLWNGEQTDFEALIDTPATAMQGGTTTVRLALSSAPASVSFDGNLRVSDGGAVPRINGKFSVDLPNPAKAVAWATGAPAPDGLGDLGTVALGGDVTATDTALNFVAKGEVGYKGRTIAVALAADGGEGWIDRQAFQVKASGFVDGLFSASFNGPVAAGDALSAKGPLSFEVSDLRGLAEWAGDVPLDAPAGTFESASLSAQLDLRGDRVDLSGVNMRLDQTTLTGDASVDMGGARPFVRANLNSGPLDLSPFMAEGSGGGGSGGGAGGQGWSTEPLDLSALRAVDAEVSIRADSVDLGDIEIGRSDIDARLQDGRLDMRIDRVDAYGGGMTGTIMVIAGQETQLATDLTLTSVQLRPLLNALAGLDSLEGLGAFRIKVAGRGSSMNALMHSLDGQGGLDMTDGAILGLNLAAIVRNLTGQTGGEQRTDFSAVTGSFDITDGVLHNTDFSFLGPLLRIVGAGTVDIGGQRQNFRLEPTAVTSLTGQGGALDQAGLSVFPILVTGTWDNPSFRPDLTAALEGLLRNPDGTIKAVTGLIEGADAGKAAGALLGAVTGGGDENSAGGALGQALGGALGGGSQDDTTGGTGSQGLGGLLGSLGGGSSDKKRDKKRKDKGEVLDQPTYSAAQPETATETQGEETSASSELEVLAPETAPLPRPAPRLAALQQQLPSEGDAVPAQQFVPEPAPEAVPQPAPEPQVLQQPEQPAPQLEPEPQVLEQPQAPAETTAEPEPEPQASDQEADSSEKDRKEKDRKRDKEGGLTPEQILQGLQKK